MDKALEVLKEIEAQKPFVYKLTSVWCRATVVNESNKIKEAIAELEATKSKGKEWRGHCPMDVDYMQIFDEHDAQLKVKDKEIAELKNNHTVINSDDYWIQNQN